MASGSCAGGVCVTRDEFGSDVGVRVGGAAVESGTGDSEMFKRVRKESWELLILADRASCVTGKSVDWV